MCYYVNSVSLLCDLETDRCNNENKKLLHKFYIMVTIHEPFEVCKREKQLAQLQVSSQNFSK